MPNSSHREWHCPPFPSDGREELVLALGVSPTVAGLLIARGCADVAAAHRFLHPSLDDLHDPFLLPDIDKAVTRLARALETGERVLVHGDYDVDGVTAAALMTRVLRALGGNVEPFVPDRRENGYDLRSATVERVAAEGVRLIVTVDCGILAYEAAEKARELGVDLIVTDHHQPGKERPAALAVVNPHCEGSQYPFKELSGVGVAFKTATALVRKLGKPETSFRVRFLDLVALGTAADCMPLLGENRILVKFGLEVLAKTAKPGLQALMQVAGVSPDRLDARALGFKLGPRINAVGRLDAARNALELLMTADPVEAMRLAQLLDRYNQERQQEQARITEEALLQARKPERHADPVLVLAAPHWHAGVIGIVASKLVEAMGRPAIMIALEGQSGRGSARSMDGFHIANAINECGELLGHHGGHAQAAGFDIAAERVDDFRRMLCRVAARTLTEEVLRPRIKVDAELSSSKVSLFLAEELHRLEPFGHGNHEPVFTSRRLLLHDAVVKAAKTGTHSHLFLRCRLAAADAAGAGSPAPVTNGNGQLPEEATPNRPLPRPTPQMVQAIYWRNGEKAEELRGVGQIDLCYSLEVNEYQGFRKVQLNIKDLRLPHDGIE